MPAVDDLYGGLSILLAGVTKAVVHCAFLSQFLMS